MLRPPARTRSITWSTRGWSPASASTRSTAIREAVTRRSASRRRASISSNRTPASLARTVRFLESFQRGETSRPSGRLPPVVVRQATRIQLCGRLIVELQGRRLEDTLRGRQGRLLFAYLALHRDRPVRRDELAEALWSGKGAPPAYESLLAPPLSRLRKALGPGVLEGRSELHLILPEDAWIDWEVAPERLRAARTASPQEAWEAAREAVEITERGLLPGLEAPWIDARRAELADLRVEALEALAAAGTMLAGAALPEAEQAARAAVQAQPFRESARAALMEVLRARGNVNEALRVYEDIRVLLREELGSSPGAALVALHEQLLRDDPAPAPARPAPAKPSSTLVERDREISLLDTLL